MEDDIFARKRAHELVEAARRGRLPEVERALADGHDLDAADRDGWTPLLAAAAHGRHEVVDYLLGDNCASRCSPNIRFLPAGALPIYMAGHSGSLECCQAILMRSPSHLFEIATVNGHTLLLQAAFYGQAPHQRLAKHILEHISEILALPASDEVSLRAVQNRLLSATNVRGQNPLALASAYSIEPMVALLKSFAPPPPETERRYYQSLLAYVAPVPPRGDRQARKQAMTEKLILTLQGAIEKATESPPESEAIDMIAQGVVAAIGQFCDEGGEIDRRGSVLERTPVIIACTGANAHAGVRHIREVMVDTLLERGADPLIEEVRAMGIDAIIRAAVWGQRTLLERFAQVVRPDDFAAALNKPAPVNGLTALHDSVLRALSAHDELLEDYLAQMRWALAHGARFDIEDHSGRTQRQIAVEALDDIDFVENAKNVLATIDALSANEPRIG